MDRLTRPEFWDAGYRDGGVKRLGDGGGARRAYADRLLWDVELTRWLREPGLSKVVEIGSAPGTNLVRLHERFGLNPWGIEYTDAGAEANRGTFSAAGLPVDQVVQADFFSDDVAQRFSGFFDVVCSFGFVEHFTDVRGTIDRHLDLLRPGGLLVVEIPNVRGLNLALMKWMNPGLVALHNLEIMDERRFYEAFDRTRVAPLRFGPIGGVNLGGITAADPVRRQALRGLRGVQAGLNLALRAVAPTGGLESAWTSPYLLFIGRKLP
jgi:SAM-dependent methyltransferase